MMYYIMVKGFLQAVEQERNIAAGAAELGGQGGHLSTQIFEKHQQND